MPPASRMGANKTERLIQEIREFAAMRFAPFKVPEHILIVDEIPKSPNGKVRRMDLAEQLKLVGSTAQRTPVEAATSWTPIEQTLMGIWVEVLKIDQPGLHDNFFRARWSLPGSDSVVTRLRREFGADLPNRQPVCKAHRGRAGRVARSDPSRATDSATFGATFVGRQGQLQWIIHSQKKRDCWHFSSLFLRNGCGFSTNSNPVIPLTTCRHRCGSEEAWTKPCSSGVSTRSGAGTIPCAQPFI